MILFAETNSNSRFLILQILSFDSILKLNKLKGIFPFLSTAKYFFIFSKIFVSGLNSFKSEIDKPNFIFFVFKYVY